MLVLADLVGLHRTVQLQLLQRYWSGIHLDYHDIEWFALEMNRDRSVVFEIASKYCISDSFVDHYIYYCRQETLRRNGVAITVNKRVQNAVLGYNLKNYRTSSVCFQGKPFNITVIQVYAPTSNTEEAEVEWFCEDLQDLLELTPKKDVLFIIGDWNAKVGSQETPGVTGNLALEYGMKQGKG